MKVIFKITPVQFSMQQQQKMVTFVTQLMNASTGMALQQRTDQFPTIVSIFFSTKDKDQEYVLISSDQDDPEAVAASRLTYALLGDLIKGGSLVNVGPRGKPQFTPQETSAMQSLSF